MEKKRRRNLRQRQKLRDGFLHFPSKLCVCASECVFYHNTIFAKEFSFLFTISILYAVLVLLASSFVSFLCLALIVLCTLMVYEQKHVQQRMK